MWSEDRPTHTLAECHRLLDRLLAVAAELERANESSDDDLGATLERMHDEAVARARNESLPATVAAYRHVYGRLPRGWPLQ
jgi:hypothetical protein